MPSNVQSMPGAHLTPQLETCTHTTHTIPTNSTNSIRVRKNIFEQRCTVSAYQPEQKLIRRKYNKTIQYCCCGCTIAVISLGHLGKFSPPAVNPSFYWLSLGENRVVHHFIGSTLETNIQYIILLNHHFTGSFLKKSPAARNILPGNFVKL